MNDLSSHCTVRSMGTVMSHKAFGELAEPCLKVICSESIRLERAFSRFIPESDISRMNRLAGMDKISINHDTLDLLASAIRFSREIEGLFDITIGPLVDLWRASKMEARVPTPDAIREILPLINSHDVKLDPRERTARLLHSGQSIDLGGIGKGYAADRFREIYMEYGIESAYSNLGGNVVTVGSKPDGSPWYVGIQHPREEDRLIGSLAVAGKSVVTSGDYQRFYIDHFGNRQHHILDPKTGYPARSGLTSVTVVSDSSLMGDAISTALFVAGLEKGLTLLGKYPGIDAIIIDDSMRVYITPGLNDVFQADQGINTIVMKEKVL